MTNTTAMRGRLNRTLSSTGEKVSAIVGINRARVELYRRLSEFRYKQNNKPLIEPGKQPDGAPPATSRWLMS